MIRCPRGFHVRLYGGTFDDDAGNHTRRVQAGEIISVEYHPDYVREFVSQLEPDTFSPGTSIAESQSSAQGAHQGSASSAHSGNADAGTGGSATFNRSSTRHSPMHHRLGTRHSRLARLAHGHAGMWFYTFSSLRAILDGKVSPTSADMAHILCELRRAWSCRLLAHSAVSHIAASRPPLAEPRYRPSPEVVPGPAVAHLPGLALVAFCLALTAFICHHHAFAEVLLPALVLVFSRHRGLGFGSILLLLSLGVPRGRLGCATTSYRCSWPRCLSS